jgi:enterochelin esterase-like enzyme
MDKLISVERREDGFSLPLLTTCILFRQLLPFECINFIEKEKEDQRLLSGSSFGFKVSLVVFLLFEFGNCSAISRVVVVLVTIVTPHVGPLMILRRLAYTTGNKFLIIYW